MSLWYDRSAGIGSRFNTAMHPCRIVLLTGFNLGLMISVETMSIRDGPI